MAFEAVDRCDETAVANCGKAGNIYVDGGGGLWDRYLYLPFGLDAGSPFSVLEAEGEPQKRCAFLKEILVGAFQVRIRTAAALALAKVTQLRS